MAHRSRAACRLLVGLALATAGLAGLAAARRRRANASAVVTYLRVLQTQAGH
jgi:hypothetical protein